MEEEGGGEDEGHSPIKPLEAKLLCSGSHQIMFSQFSPGVSLYLEDSAFDLQVSESFMIN